MAQAKRLSKQAKELSSQLDALHAGALEHGLLHLDLRGSNIGVVMAGDQPRLTLLDWGKCMTNVSTSKLLDNPGGQLL
jgi:hypothetical protein